jgi:thiol-disulfide isomerase/thioredoxin
MNRRQFGGAALGALIGAGWKLPGLFAAANPKSKVAWAKDLKTAHDAALEHDKPLLLVFGATWCTFCHKLHRETFTDRALAAFIDREFVPLALDFDEDERVVEILEVEQLPCTIVLSPAADLLLRYIGFAKPAAYQKELQSALNKRDKIKVTRGTDAKRRQ